MLCWHKKDGKVAYKQPFPSIFKLAEIWLSPCKDFRNIVVLGKGVVPTQALSHKVYLLLFKITIVGLSCAYGTCKFLQIDEHVWMLEYPIEFAPNIDNKLKVNIFVLHTNRNAE